MEGTIKEFLIKKTFNDKIASEQDGDVLHFEATTNPSIYKVVCAKVSMAHWLCCTLTDQAVTQKDSMANISFKSPFHQPMQQD